MVLRKSDNDEKHDEVLYTTENCFSDSSTKTVLILWPVASHPC